LRSALVLACLALSCVSSVAQEIDSIDYLPAVLIAGERVIVTAATCETADSAAPLVRKPCRPAGSPATVRGKVEHVGGDDGLVIAAASRTYLVPLGGIERVERSKDHIWNGAVLGYGAGVAAALALDALDSRKGMFSGAEFALGVGMVITGPIGFGLGALTDAGMSRPRLVFAAPKPSGVARATASPILSRHGAGLAVSIGF
jgi:hypothetical protein